MVNSKPPPDTNVINVNPIKVSNLYRQEIFHDPEAGSLVRNTPVMADGLQDPMRAVTFHGSTTATFSNRAIPVNFVVPGENLMDAILNYPDACRKAIQNLLDQSIRNQILNAVPSANSPRLDLSGNLPPKKGN